MSIKITPLTHKELAKLYRVSWSTLQRWLKPHEDKIGKKLGHFFTVKQVGIIFNILGVPESLYNLGTTE